MSNEDAVHAQPVPTRYALGTRRSARQDATSVGQDTRGIEMATPDGRACLRDVQNVDGINPLPDQDATKSANGDEFARAGVQHEASNKHFGNANADAGNAGLNGLCALGLRRPRQSQRNRTIRVENAQTTRLEMRFHTPSAEIGLPRSKTLLHYPSAQI